MKKIPYGRQSISNFDIETVARALKNELITQGLLVERFERSVASFCEVKYSVAVNSGTAALHLMMLALGIGSGDEVITTPLSFAATANCVLYCGGTPVFADVDYETGLLDPVAVESKITKNTKAIITVDYSGHPSFFKQLHTIAIKYNLALLDDAAHSLGAKYEGKRIGTQALMTTFSFHPVKLITTGEGGAVVTNNKKLYEKLLLFRTHGITKNADKFMYAGYNKEQWYYEMQELGFNYRITDFQCALGLSQMTRAEDFLQKRKSIANLYNESFKSDPRFRIYTEQKKCQSGWHLYPLRIMDRKFNKVKLFEQLKRHGIRLQVHYIPIYLHPYYQRKFGYKRGDFPNAEKFYREEISLPIYYDLKINDVKKIVKRIKEIV